MKPAVLALLAAAVLAGLFFALRDSDPPGSAGAEPAARSEAERRSAELDSIAAPSPERVAAVDAAKVIEAPAGATALEEGATLALSVVDQRGDAVADLRIMIGAEDRSAPVHDPLTGAPTDAQGRLEVEVPAGLKLNVWGMPGERPLKVAYAAVDALAPGERFELRLEVQRQGGLLEVLVVAADDGAPIEGATLQRMARRAGGFEEVDAEGRTTGLPEADRTDREGRVRFDLAQAAGVRVRVDAAGFGRQVLLLPDSAEPGDEPLVLRLERAAAIYGLLAGASSAGRVGASVGDGELQPPGFASRSMFGKSSWRARTDDSGSFELAGLPPNAPLEVVASGGPGGVTLPTQRLVLQPGERREVFWSVDQLAEVRVQVVDERGQGLAGVELRLIEDAESRMDLVGPEVASRAQATTDEWGATRFLEVPPGLWLVAPAPAEDGAPPEEQIAPQATRFEVPPGATAVDVAVIAYRGLFVAGRVFGLDGEPQSGVLVTGVRPGTGLHETTSSGQDGSFSLGPLVPGPFVVDAGRLGILSGYCASEPVEVEAGAEGIELFLRRPGSVVVRVVDAETGDLVSADVLAYGLDAAFISTIGGEAPVAFDALLPGRYTFAAWTDGGRVGALGPVEVEESVQPPELELRVARGGLLEVVHQGANEPYDLRLFSSGRLIQFGRLVPGRSKTFLLPLGSARVVAQLYPGGVDERGEVLKQVQEHEVTIAPGDPARLVLSGR